MRRPSSRALDVIVPLCGVLIGAVVVILAVRWNGTSDELSNTVLVYGDSAALPEPDFSTNVKERTGGEVVVHSNPGTAICDYLVQMRTDVRGLRPAVVVLAFSGSTTPPCVTGATGTALAERYSADARTAINDLSAGGSHVLLVSAPGSPIEGYFQGIAAEWATDRAGKVSYAASDAAVGATAAATAACGC